MAWRIHDNIIRGEIDNRQRGRIRGKLWLKGLADPVTLQLEGNACPDLAGCLLTFENPGEVYPMRTDAVFTPVQKGTIGDLTASRKVRVYDIPVEEAYMRLKKKLPVPEHMANCLYLEWFSDTNGRVVVESADYKLTISPPSWRLSSDEEGRRQDDAAAGFSGFMQKLSDALAAKKHNPPEDKEWDEFDYEKFMRECDARTDKYAELLDKYIDHPDRDQIIAKEMGWTWLEKALGGEEGQSHGEPAEKETSNEEADKPWLEVPDDLPELEPNPATEGVDWVRDEYGHPTHPLALRALNGSVRLWQTCDQLGLEELDDADIAELVGEYQTTAAKLSGALDDLAFDRELRDGAFIVAYLKRALSHLHGAQAALEKVVTRELLPEDRSTAIRTEFFALREAILELMKRFRTEP